MSAGIYTTALSKDECLRLLERHTGRGAGVRWVEGTVTAKIRGDRFRLFAWGPTSTRNSLAPFFYGRLEERTSGTLIRGGFQMHPMVRGFLVVWFGGLVVKSGLLLFLPASAWGHGQPPAGFTAFLPLGMALLGLGFVRVCRWLARGQMESLRGFLARELQAQIHVKGAGG